MAGFPTPSACAALLLAAITTLTVALLLRVQPGREIPFGPGLLLGAWTIFIIA